VKRPNIFHHYPIETRCATGGGKAGLHIHGPVVDIFLRHAPATLALLESLQLEEWMMSSPNRKTLAPSLQPALELIYLATLQPEVASQSLRRLLLANPGYFGSLSENSFKVVLNINGDTRYESLGCVSYIPLLGQLYASIKLNQERGYSFQVGEPGSREHIRFYLSYDRGVTWHDQGLTSINVCDEPGAKARVHLVTRRIRLREDAETTEVAPIIRATLSWNTPPPPDDPDWTPLWGNVVETTIQSVGIHFRRRSRLQTDSWVVSADETASEERVGRPSDSADVRPVGALTPTGLFSESRLKYQNL
jgi:hypothetical protein